MAKSSAKRRDTLDEFELEALTSNMDGEDPQFVFESSKFSIPLSTTFTKDDVELDRTVSIWSGIGLIVGSSIGSGIFASPGVVYSDSGSIGASLLVWIVAGILSVTGGLCYAELGTMIPSSGGEHPYLLRAFGPCLAFLYSWTGIVAGRPGSLGIISVVCAEYICLLIYFDNPAAQTPQWLIKSIAIAVVLCLSMVNIVSSRASTLLMDTFTVLKVVSLALIAAMGVYRLAMNVHDTDNFERPLFEGSSSNPSNYAIALYSALWAYDGWNGLNMVTGELKNPAVNLPRAIIAGLSIVTICYTFVNLSYFIVLPDEIIKVSKSIGMDFGKTVFGHIGGIIIPLVVIGSTLGSANASLFTGSRVLFVSAQQGHAPRFLSTINPHTRTPLNAVMLQGATTVFFILIGNFKTLVNLYSMIVWTFYLFAVLGLLTLRMVEPYVERPFSVWLPIPILFCSVTVFLLSFSVWEAPLEALGAFVFLISGFPIWWIGSTYNVDSEGIMLD